MKLFRIVLVFCLSIFATTLQASLINAIDADGTLVSNVFSSSFSNLVETTDSSTAYQTGGFSGSYLRTDASGTSSMTFVFQNLAAHSSIDLGFIIARIGSVDPSRDGDVFSVTVDGVEVISGGLGFGNANGFSEPLVHDYKEYGVTADSSIVTATQSAYVSSSWGTHIYDFNDLDVFSGISHTSDTLTVTISASTNQGYSNEAYGFDNVSIGINYVSAPAGLLVALVPMLILCLRRGK